MNETFWLQLIASAIGPVATLLLAWGIGYKLSTSWNIRQKQQELNLVAAAQFFQLYGEFFALWKLWNYMKNGVLMADDKSAGLTRGALLVRACTAEASAEALYVKLALDKHDNDTLYELNMFRQAYQMMRESIRNNTELEWDWSEHPQYLRFKQLACRVACLLLPTVGTGPQLAGQQLVQITSNKFEREWKDLGTAAIAEAISAHGSAASS